MLFDLVQIFINHNCNVLTYPNMFYIEAKSFYVVQTFIYKRKRFWLSPEISFFKVKHWFNPKFYIMYVHIHGHEHVYVDVHGCLYMSTRTCRYLWLCQCKRRCLWIWTVMYCTCTCTWSCPRSCIITWPWNVSRYRQMFCQLWFITLFPIKTYIMHCQLKKSPHSNGHGHEQNRTEQSS
jgi:hypothetical protein